MPSGPPELHEKFCALADDGMSGDSAAMRFLEGRGFKLTRQWTWVPPENHTITEEENEAIYYLIAEWDFGGIVEVEEH
jgi:hypothetical protein